MGSDCFAAPSQKKKKKKIINPYLAFRLLMKFLSASNLVGHFTECCTAVSKPMS